MKLMKPFLPANTSPPIGVSLLSLAMAGSLLLSSPMTALAKANNAQPTKKTNVQTSTTTPKPASASAKKERPPVLSAEARKAINEAALKLDPQTRLGLNKLSESLHTEDKAVNNDLRDDEELSITDIGMLWEAAVERSGTIRYAIEKLSRRDATGKPVDNDSFTKRVVQNLVHLGGVAGTMWTGTPAGLIGSNMVQDLISGSPQDSALSRVTDADMVILAKEVEALQSQLIEQYYTYRQTQERLTMAREASATIEKYYDHAFKTTSANSEVLQPLMQSMLDNAKQEEQKAQQAYSSSRSALSMLVGVDAIAALDQTRSKTSDNSH
jgi:hypothetical protein